MSEITHDPSEYIKGLQKILISDKKKIAFLFGAGTSLAKNKGVNNPITVPAIKEMTKQIIEKLSENEKFSSAFKRFEREDSKTKENIEVLLTLLEQKKQVVGDDRLNDLSKDDFSNLIDNIKASVRKIVSVHYANGKLISKSDISCLVQTDLANWIGSSERKSPIEIFTTNYDFLFELGLEFHEIPYYDGFSGTVLPFFNPISVEDMKFLNEQTKLWKIHGSLGWHYNQDMDRIIRSEPKDDDILIYPSTLKYQQSKKQPYESLLDRLSKFLKQDDSILFTCGYSWGDEHINARILSALKSNSTSHVVAFIYSDIDKNSDIAKIGFANNNVSFYGEQHAIIGGKYGQWKLKKEPIKEETISVNTYFHEDSIPNPSMEVNNQEQGSETGTRRFILGDFTAFVCFLNSLIPNNEIKRIADNDKY